jgi:hypothetical protein
LRRICAAFFVSGGNSSRLFSFRQGMSPLCLDAAVEQVHGRFQLRERKNKSVLLRIVVLALGVRQLVEHAGLLQFLRVPGLSLFLHRLQIVPVPLISSLRALHIERQQGELFGVIPHGDGADDSFCGVQTVPAYGDGTGVRIRPVADLSRAIC